LASVRIFHSYLKTPFLLLLIFESCVFFIAVYAASYVRFYSHKSSFTEIFDDLWKVALVFAVITILSMLATGLYQGQIREGFAGVLIRIVISFVASIVLTSLLFYLLPALFLGRGIMAISYLQSFFVIATARAVFFELVDSSAFKTRILVYGAGETASHIDAKLRRKADRRGFDIVGYILLSGQTCQITKSNLINSRDKVPNTKKAITLASTTTTVNSPNSGNMYPKISMIKAPINRPVALIMMVFTTLPAEVKVEDSIRFPSVTASKTIQAYKKV